MFISNRPLNISSESNIFVGFCKKSKRSHIKDVLVFLGFLNRSLSPYSSYTYNMENHVSLYSFNLLVRTSFMYEPMGLPDFFIVVFIRRNYLQQNNNICQVIAEDSQQTRMVQNYFYFIFKCKTTTFVVSKNLVSMWHIRIV